MMNQAMNEDNRAHNANAVARKVIESSTRPNTSKSRQIQYGGGGGQGSGAASLINGTGGGDDLPKNMKGGSATGADGTIKTSNWLNNILPAPKGGEQQQRQTPPPEQQQQQQAQQPPRPESPAASEASSVAVPPMGSPQKGVNLLSEAPNMGTSGRKLNEKETRDCEVIGTLP